MDEIIDKYSTEDEEETLADLIKDFSLIVSILQELSLKFENVVAPIRKAISTYFLAHICDSCSSILKLLPYNKLSTLDDKNYSHFFTLSLFRNIIEATNNIFYFSLEEITTEEYEFRLLLYSFHGDSEIIRLSEFINLDDDLKKNTIAKIANKKKELSKNKFFKSLNRDIQKLIINGKRYSHLTQFEIAERRGINKKSFSGFYKLLSGYTHSLPNAIDSIAVTTIHEFKKEFEESVLSLVIFFINGCLADITVRMGKLWNEALHVGESKDVITHYNSCLFELNKEVIDES